MLNGLEEYFKFDTLNINDDVNDDFILALDG